MKLRIVGVSGSGKSALADRLAIDLGLARLDLDAVFWDANWTLRDPDEACGIVRDFAARHPDGWVADGNWSSRLGGLLEPGTPDGADTFVWLDHSRALVMSRIIRRTVRRGILREELWHGNRERASTWLRWEPDRNIMRWAWVQHPVIRQRMLEKIAQGMPVVRLSGQRAVDGWIADLRRQDA